MVLIAIEYIEEGVRWTADGRTTHSSSSVEALMAKLAVPHAVICEPFFYDGLCDVRRMFSEILARRGHRLVPMEPGAKAALEAAAGDVCVGVGVRRLHSIATAGSARLDRLRFNSENVWKVKAALDIVHAIDTVQTASSAYDLAVQAVGPYGALAEPLKIALGDGQAYRRGVLLAAYRAATVATSRGEFEHLLGLNAGGNGAITQTLRAWYAERNTTEQFERDSVLGWSEYRKALRFVFHRIKDARGANPRAA